MKRNTSKVDVLLKQNKKVFHTKDLELLWGITNKATLHNTILRYTQKGVLIPIYRGFYATVPLKNIDPIELGASAIHEYAYLSTEMVLSQSGVIFQSIEAYTFCSSKSKRICIYNNTYIIRQLKDEYLYNTKGIIDKGTYKIATLERAVADMLYFNPQYYIDARNQINWDKVKDMQKEVYKNDIT
ncbi:MAG: type IV toxin-antitoxin system AbiEi family antitoxin domain-containing protein [bacterium]